MRSAYHSLSHSSPVVEGVLALLSSQTDLCMFFSAFLEYSSSPLGSATPRATTASQAAFLALFRVVNRYVGNLQAMLGVFANYRAPAIRNTSAGSEMTC